MLLTFLGVSSAFSFESFQSNMLLEVNGKRLLIDAGGDARRSLHALGLGHRDLHGVYISHLHEDHIGSMEWLSLATKYDPGFVNDDGSKRKLDLFLDSSLKRGLWDALKHGCPLPDGIATLATYFNVNTCKKGEFKFGGVKFKLIRTVHYIDNGKIAPSYGLMWKAPNGQTVFLTTDTMLVPYFKDFYAKADVIFHDCETSKFPTPVHAHYTELVTLPEAVRGKMWLYHCQDGTKRDAIADGFAGYVKQGQKFDFSK